MSAITCHGDICVLGGIITDFICYVDREPVSGETVLANSFSRGFGGKGANQCVMAARLGAKCAILGKVGDDPDGHSTLINFEEHTIGTDSVEVDSSSHTGVALISVETPTGKNRIIVGQGVNKLVDAKFIQSHCGTIQNSRITLAGMEVCQDAVVESLKIAKNSGRITILNPAPVPPDFNPELFSLADFLCPNEHEAASLLGRSTDSIKDVEDAKRIAVDLRKEKGANCVVITLGEKGCVALENNSEIPVHLESPSVTAIDTTGAGDAFCGSLAFFLSHCPHLTFEEQVRRSCFVASVSVQRKGTQLSFPTRESLPQYLFV